MACECILTVTLWRLSFLHFACIEKQVKKIIILSRFESSFAVCSHWRLHLVWKLRIWWFNVTEMQKGQRDRHRTPVHPCQKKKKREERQNNSDKCQCDRAWSATTAWPQTMLAQLLLDRFREPASLKGWKQQNKFREGRMKQSTFIYWDGNCLQIKQLRFRVLRENGSAITGTSKRKTKKSQECKPTAMLQASST